MEALAHFLYYCATHPDAEIMQSLLGGLINDDRIIFKKGVEKISAEIKKEQKLIIL